MKWAEVIKVRSAGSDSKVLASALRELWNDLARDVGNDAIRVFRREKPDSDICLVLFHNGAKKNIGASPTGLRIVAALKEVGLIHHTIWSEIVR